MDDRRTHAAGRLLELTALAVLVLATGTALSRIFRFDAATADLIVVAAVALVASAATVRLRGYVALPIVTALTAWTVAWRAVPAALDGGLPTVTAGRRVLAALLAAPEDARIAIAPVVVTRPFLVAALCGIGLTTILAHALLVRVRTPLVAILPPLAVVAVADLSLGRSAPPGSTIALTVAALGVVLADGVGRILAYGRVEPPLGLRTALLAATRGARLPLALVTALAVVAPGILPGATTEPLLDLSGRLPGVTQLQPFVSIRAELERDDRRELFRVRTDGGEGAYWRLFALDRFDGSEWTASPATLSDPLAGPVDLPFARVDPQASLLAQDVEFLIDGIGGGWIPLAYPAARVDGEGTIRFDADAATVRLDPEPEAGDRYTVVSAPLSPTPGTLDEVRFLDASVYGRYTELPVESARALARIAAAWTAGAETPYRRVLALQDRFLDGSFRYSLDVPEDEPGTDPILRFLRESRVGFCQQFATAMAALVRSLGYPARVAVGFRQGERRGTTYTVTNLDAHAWVEVFFPGVGWLAFEPTPGRPNPAATPGSYLQPTTAADGAGAEGGANDAAGGTDTPDRSDAASCTLPDGTVLPARLCRDGGETAPAVGGGGAAASEDRDGPIPIVAIVLAIALLSLVGFPFLRGRWRRRRAERAADPRGRTLAAFAAFAGEARDLGFGRGRAETLPEYAARIGAVEPDLDAELHELVDVAGVAAYGPTAPDAATADQAVATARAAAERLRRNAGWTRRILGAYGVGWLGDSGADRGAVAGWSHAATHGPAPSPAPSKRR